MWQVADSYAGFQCIGNACEDNCCTGWRVPLAEAEFQRYQSCEHPTLTPLIGEFVQPVPQVSTRQGGAIRAFAEIRLRENGACPFLDEQRWCAMHREAGEEFLSEACDLFPRTLLELDGRVEGVLSLACPEAARQVLQRTPPAQWVEQAEPARAAQYQRRFQRLDTGLFGAEAIQAVCQEAVNILQVRELPLDARMVLLGIFSGQVHDAMHGKGAEEMLFVCAGFAGMRQQTADFLVQYAGLPVNPEHKLGVLNRVVMALMSGVSSPRLLECLNDFMLGMGTVGGSAHADTLLTNYLSGYAEYWHPFEQQHGVMLEQYLVNQAMISLYPFTGAKSSMENFALLTLKYAVLKFIGVGMARQHQRFTPSMLVKLVQSVTRTLEHNPPCTRKLYEQIVEQGWNDLGMLVPVIKDI